MSLTSPDIIAQIQRLACAGETKIDVCRKLNLCVKTVRKYWPDEDEMPTLAERLSLEPVTAAPEMPDPSPEANGIFLPQSQAVEQTAVHINEPGWYLVFGDQHLPMHDRGTIEAAVKEAKDKNVVGVLINGDLMDMFVISPFFRVPSKDTFVEEIEVGRQFLTWLRARLPKAQFWYRQGNHEFRLTRYIAERAAALFDLPEVHLPALLRLKDFGVEWVQDKRKVMLGKLTTLHGHELRKGEGVNPARLAFLRTTATVLVSHHHRTSEHHQRSLDDKFIAAWSVGCACSLHPDYDPFGQSNHGYAMVHVGDDGWFSVHNRRVINGRVV